MRTGLGAGHPRSVVAGRYARLLDEAVMREAARVGAARE